MWRAPTESGSTPHGRLPRVRGWRFSRCVLALAVAGGLVGIPAAATAQQCIPPPANLVSWWQGEGNANDSADGNHGVPQGAVSFAAGKVGQAFSFDDSPNSLD